MSKRKIVLGVIGILVLLSLLVPQVALAQGGPGGRGRGNTSGSSGRGGGRMGNASGAYTVTDTLDPEEEQALLMAIDDEYKALATYLGVMDQFGQVAPFVTIARAEENHIAALERLFDRYGLEIPENEWIGNTAEFDSVTDACEAGVQAEIDNAALYDQLFSMVDNRDIVQVFTNLHNASEYSHLPAFSSCVDADGVIVPQGTGPSVGNGGIGGWRGVH